MDRGHNSLPRYRGSGSFSNLNTAVAAQDPHAFQAYSASTPDISSLYAAQQVSTIQKSFIATASFVVLTPRKATEWFKEEWIMKNGFEYLLSFSHNGHFLVVLLP